MNDARWAVVSAALVACGSPGPAATPEEGSAMLPTQMVLTDPHIVDLGLPADLADGGVCHTQGLALDGDELVLSCVVYDPDAPELKTVTSSALVLRAPFEPPRTWRVTDITAPVSADASRRITRQLLERDELNADEEAIVRVMSHPSGLALDARRGGVWVANAVYAAKSHTRFARLSRDGVELHPVELPGEHVGAIALVADRYLIGWTWDSQHVVGIDLDDPSAPVVVIPNPLLDTEDLVAIQDCHSWDAEHVLCAGMYKYTTGEGDDEVKHRIGRLQLLRVDVSSFPALSLYPAGYVAVDFGDGPTTALGERHYRVDADDNDVFLHENVYAGHRTPFELTYEGMALSADRRHVYFLPEDVPEGRMIRMTLGPR